MLIYRAYEQLTPIYDNVFAIGKKLLSQSGHQIFDVFSYIANCFLKGAPGSSVRGRGCFSVLDFS